MAKIEVRCPACNHDYVLERENLPRGGGEIPCLACGAMIPVTVPPRPRVAGTVHAGAVHGKPKSGAPRQPAAPPPRSSQEQEEVVCPRCHLHFRPRTELATDPQETRQTVLVVEDMEYFRRIARDALSEKYDVRTAESSEEALRIIRAGGIDLLVLDLTLDQDGGGMGILSRLQPKPCPILIFTAADESEMYGERWEELKKFGADDLVLKGMNVGDSLSKKVGEMLGEPWDAEEIRVQG